VQMLDQPLLETLAAASQPRHDRPQGNAGDTCNLSVRKPFQLTQNKHLAIFDRQLVQGLAQEAPVLGLEDELLRVERVIGGSVRRFVVGHGQLLSAVLSQPRVARIAHDGQQPDSTVRAMKAIEESERAQKRLLHQVFGVVPVACQPARQVIGGIQVRQKGLLKAGLSAKSVFPLACILPTRPPRQLLYSRRKASERGFSQDLPKSTIKFLFTGILRASAAYGLLRVLSRTRGGFAMADHRWADTAARVLMTAALPAGGCSQSVGKSPDAPASEKPKEEVARTEKHRRRKRK
jgi:hypothetical protein